MPEYRVLLVDDEPDSAEALAALLEMEGCATRVVNSPLLALAEMDHFEPLCLLMDLDMPQMSGAEMAAALRARFGTDLVLVAITGYDSQSPQARAARDAGVDYVMTKPVDVEKLVHIMGLRH